TVCEGPKRLGHARVCCPPEYAFAGVARSYITEVANRRSEPCPRWTGHCKARGPTCPSVQDAIREAPSRIALALFRATVCEGPKRLGHASLPSPERVLAGVARSYIPEVANRRSEPCPRWAGRYKLAGVRLGS